MKWMIYCPSYKRSNSAISHKLFDKKNFYYVIRESEKDDYTKLGNNLLIIPESAQVKDISTTRNWILKNRISDYIIQVDDDLKSIIWLLKREKKYLNIKEIERMIENGFQMAEDCKAGLWGINCQSDPKFYQINRPFSFSNIVLGPFSGILDPSIVYDERLPLKEDYDLFLNHLNKHRVVLRFNMFSYDCDHFKLEGGCQTYRNKNDELNQIELLKKKWGSEIIKDNWRHKDSVNVTIKRPI